MKNLSVRLTALVLALCAAAGLSSCRREREIDKEIAELQAAVLEARAASEAETPDDPNLPDEVTQDEPSPEPVFGYDGILSSGYTVVDGKYYFLVQKEMGINQTVGGVTMPVSYDLASGNWHILCPDPFCPHNDYDLCKYIDFTELFFTHGVTLYGIKQGSWKNKLFRLDLNADTEKLIYTPKDHFPVILGTDGGILYLSDCSSVRYDRKVSYHFYLVGIDLATDEVVLERDIPDMYTSNKLGAVYTVLNGKFLCKSADGLYSTDLDFKNPKRILANPEEGGLGQWYYDTVTDEFYFNLVSETEGIGKVYVYKDGEARMVDLPAENIYVFQLTRDKIYYSPFDPIILGYSDGFPIKDQTSGKIYAADRNDPSAEPVLIYDNRGERILCIESVAYYCIFDGQLFYDEIETGTRRWADGSEGFYTSVAGDRAKIRVDLRTGEEEFIQFEG